MMEEKTCMNCKFKRRRQEFIESPCCACMGASEWKSEESKETKGCRNIENFKRFLKRLSNLCDEYNVTEISTDNDGRVSFASNDEIASIASLTLSRNGKDWRAMGMSITTKPACIYFDREEKN